MRVDYEGVVVSFKQMIRVGQNHTYTVCIRYFKQKNHHIYGHIRCIYMVLANPTNDVCVHVQVCLEELHEH